MAIDILNLIDTSDAAEYVDTLNAGIAHVKLVYSNYNRKKELHK